MHNTNYINEHGSAFALPTGAISMDQIADMVGISHTGINLNDWRVRELADKPSPNSIISMNDCRGKKYYSTITIGKYQSSYGFCRYYAKFGDLTNRNFPDGAICNALYVNNNVFMMLLEGKLPTTKRTEIFIPDINKTLTFTFDGYYSYPTQTILKCDVTKHKDVKDMFANVGRKYNIRLRS